MGNLGGFHRLSFLVSFFLLVLLVFVLPPSEAQLVVQEPITLNPKTGSTQISLVLNVKPTSTVVIIIDSDCLKFSACSVTFTPANWNVAQQVTAYLDAGNKNFTCCPVSFTIKATCFPPVTVEVQVCRVIPAPPSCGQSHGDPHFSSFDGLRFDGFAVGDFHLVRETSGYFSVQVRHAKVAAASYNSAVAVKYGSYVFYAQAVGSPTPEVSAVGSATDNGVLVSQDGDVFTLITPTEVKVVIKTTPWKGQQKYFLAVDVFAPPTLTGLLAGLIGLFDGSQGNDFLTPLGTLATDGTAFNLAWAVESSENLFLDPQSFIPPIFGHPGGASYSTGKYCNGGPVKPPGCLGFLDNCSKKSPICDFPPPSGPPAIDCATALAQNPGLLPLAKQKCDALFGGPTATCCKNKGVKPDDYYNACICDYVLAGGDDFCVDNLNSYLTYCAAVGAKKGFTCNPCSCDCNGHGSCVSGNCVCTPPWKGARCDENWTNPPCITKVVPQGTATCDSKVVSLFVYGTGFFGNDIDCIINGKTVKATKVSNFQLVCPFPTLPQGTSQLTVVVSVNNVLSQPFSLTLKLACCANPCVHGTCTDTANGFTCNCAGTPYEGRLCETPSFCAASVTNNATIEKTDNNECSFYKCPPGQRLYVKRCCNGGKLGSPVFGCQPYANKCRAEGYCNASWATTYEGQTAFGICDKGFKGEPSRDCQEGGTWGSVCTNPCQRSYCVGLIEGNATWPDTLLNQPAHGTCLPGFIGSPSRTCSSTGSFGPIQNPCIPAPCFCPAVKEDGVTWPKTSVGTKATISCPPYYKGTRSRFCKTDGTFGPVEDHCVPVFCPQLTDANGIFWPQTPAGGTSEGKCPDDCRGGPTRPCLADGTFGPITGSCTPVYCQSYRDPNGVFWPTTRAGAIATGKCPDDCTGGPTRPCKFDGTFGPVTGQCVQKKYCPEIDSWHGYDWPKTPAGSTATQPCPRGTKGTLTRECDETGSWEDVDDECKQIYCDDDGNDSWQWWTKTAAGDKCYGRCKKGKGNPWRDCDWDGKLGPVQNPCR